MSDTFTLNIEGKPYTVSADDLELGEVELLEETMDAALDEINFSRAKAMRVLVYILVKRDNPDFTMEDASHIKLASFADSAPADTDAPAAAKRPTKAAKSG
jgi:hypothetical protein